MHWRTTTETSSSTRQHEPRGYEAREQGHLIARLCVRNLRTAGAQSIAVNRYGRTLCQCS